MRILVVCSLLFLLIGCANKNEAETRYLVPFDFDNAKTYGFHALDSAYSQQQNMSHAMRNSIELAIERSFDERGFRFVEKQPDIIIGFRLFGVNGSVFNGRKESICRDCKPSRRQRKAQKIGESLGGIMLEVQSGETQLSVWRSTFPISLKGDENSAEMNEELATAIEEIVMQYPTNNRAQQVILSPQSE